MGTKVFYFKAATPSGSYGGSLQDGADSVIAAAAVPYGWTMVTSTPNNTGATFDYTQNVTVAASYSLPAALATSSPGSDTFRSEKPITGVFAGTNWSIKAALVGSSTGNCGKATLRYKLWKSASPDGGSGTALITWTTSGAFDGADHNGITSASASVAVTTTLTNSTAFTFDGEYLFLQVALYETAVAGASSRTVKICVDSANGYAITTPNFTGHITTRPLKVSVGHVLAHIPRMMADDLLGYADFFLNSAASVVQLDLLEISHPSFTSGVASPGYPGWYSYFIVRNHSEGVTVTLETGDSQAFTYYPLKIEGSSTRENLDYGLKVTLGDLGLLIPDQIDAVLSAEMDPAATIEGRHRPRLIYRVYRSDQLPSGRIYGPVTLDIYTVTMTRDGAAFEAKAPSLNLSRTGEVYSLKRFPMLRGCL